MNDLAPVTDSEMEAHIVQEERNRQARIRQLGIDARAKFDATKASQEEKPI